jgi:hypothetical protein
MLYTSSPAFKLAICRSPSGVAIGVSGEAQMHKGAQPSGQVPCSFGSLQCGPCSMGPCGSQQSWLPEQHSPPQQLSPLLQVVSQGGVMQAPFVQYSPNAQGLPHDPQFCGSFCRLTQCSSQQLRASPQPVRQELAEPPLDVLPPLLLPAAPPELPERMGSLQLASRSELIQASPTHSPDRFMRRV